MKIGIDASLLDTTVKTGVAQYMKNLVFGLSDVDSENHYILYYNSLRRSKDDFPGPDSANFEKRVVRIPSFDSVYFNRLWAYSLSRAMKADQVDIAHVMNSYFPQNAPFKTVVTIHDMYSYDYFVSDGAVLTPMQRFLKVMMERSVTEADRIIAVSENTKGDLLSFFPFADKKTDVICPGVVFSAGKVSEADKKALKEKYSLGENNILFIGTFARNKNIPVLLKAFSLLKAKNRDFKHKLILVGKHNGEYSEVGEDIKKLGIEDDVVITGYVPQEEIASFYATADMLVFPSFKEGFGIPCIEAMSYGVPLVVSDIPVFRDVAGDSALYFAPESPESLADAISSLIADKKLGEEMVEKGRINCERFDRRSVSRDMVKLYERLSAKEEISLCL